MRDDGLPEVGDILLIGMYRKPAIVVEGAVVSTVDGALCFRVKTRYDGTYRRGLMCWTDDYVRYKPGGSGQYYGHNVRFDAEHKMMPFVYDDLSAIASGRIPQHAGVVSVSMFANDYRPLPSGTSPGDYLNIYCDILYYDTGRRLVCEACTTPAPTFSFDLSLDLATILGDRAICLKRRGISIAILNEFLLLDETISGAYGKNPLPLAEVHLRQILAEIEHEKMEQDVEAPDEE